MCPQSIPTVRFCNVFIIFFRCVLINSKKKEEEKEIVDDICLCLYTHRYVYREQVNTAVIKIKIIYNTE